MLAKLEKYSFSQMLCSSHMKVVLLLFDGCILEIDYNWLHVPLTALYVFGGSNKIYRTNPRNNLKMSHKTPCGVWRIEWANFQVIKMHISTSKQIQSINIWLLSTILVLHLFGNILKMMVNLLYNPILQVILIMLLIWIGTVQEIS